MRKSAIEIIWNCVFYSKSISTIVNSTYIRKVLPSSTKLLLRCYAASVCTSCIFSHLFLGNIISSLVKGIYSYCKTRAWLYCKVYNKEYNIVILFSKWGENFTQERSDNQKTALAKRESKFSVDSVISAESTWPLFSRT